MKRLLFILAFVAGWPALGFSQGAIMPPLPPEFRNATGAIASGAKLCSFSAGTTTPKATYSNITLGSALPNPITLSSLGRPTTNGSTETLVYLDDARYKFTLYAAGTGNTCNGTTVGTVIWTRDNVESFNVLNEDFNPKIIDNVVFCSQMNGANMGEKIVAAIALLPSTGGTVDCRGLEGTQTIAQNVWSGVTKKGTLLLGAATITVSVAQTPPTGWTIKGLGRKTTVFSISGNITAFSFVADVTATYLGFLEVVGNSSTAACIKYDESYENMAEYLSVSGCNIGVHLTDGGAISGSAFSNSFHDSLIISATGTNAINILCELNCNNTLFSKVTFGGSPAKIGIKILDSNSVTIIEGNCEGVNGGANGAGSTGVACIDIDSSNGAYILGGFNIIGNHFEGNYAEFGDIRIGNTNTILAGTITGNFFHSPGIAKSYAPVNMVRAQNWTFGGGNIVASGYPAGVNRPVLGTVTNITDTGNRWEVPDYTLFRGQDVYLESIRERTTGNIFTSYSAPDTRIHLVNSGGALAIRNTANSASVFKIYDAGTMEMATGVQLLSGSGAPGGGCTRGSIYLRSDNFGAGAVLYACENAVWVSK